MGFFPGSITLRPRPRNICCRCCFPSLPLSLYPVFTLFFHRADKNCLLTSVSLLFMNLALSWHQCAEGKSHLSLFLQNTSHFRLSLCDMTELIDFWAERNIRKQIPADIYLAYDVTVMYFSLCVLTFSHISVDI